MLGIGEVIGGISGIFKTWLTGRQEKQKAIHKMKVAEINNKARLLQSKESHNHAWEMAILMDKDKPLQRVSFCLISAPFIIAIFFPEHVKAYFDQTISSVPEWWQKIYIGIMAGIWGISGLKNGIPAIAAAFRKPK